MTGFWLTTGVLEEGNQRFYKRAGYRLVPGEPTYPGRRRPRQTPPLTRIFAARSCRSAVEPVAQRPTTGQAPSVQLEMTVYVVDDEGRCTLANDTPASYPSSQAVSLVACRWNPRP